MLVKHYPQILDQIRFNVNFQNDAIICDALKRHYKLYSYLFKCIEDNIDVLQDKADLRRDYYNQLYETTLFTYNPIENYNMIENESGSNSQTVNNSSSQSSNNTVTQTPEDWKTSTREGGYDVGSSLADTSESEQSGTYTTTNEGSATSTDSGTSSGANTRQLSRSGNIGITTSQQMIQSERDIILNLLELYINEFADCFNLEF